MAFLAVVDFSLRQERHNYSGKNAIISIGNGTEVGLCFPACGNYG